MEVWKLKALEHRFPGLKSSSITLRIYDFGTIIQSLQVLFCHLVWR